MAGRPGNAAEIVRLSRELTEVRSERDRYRRIIVSIDPAYLDQDKPAPLEDFDETVVNRMMAMADMGMDEDQWIGEFGISRATWAGWKALYPELSEAVDVALQRVLGWWHERSRLAQERGNTRFPLSVYKARVEQIEASMVKATSEAQRGDASKLVLLDLRRVTAGFPDPAADQPAAEDVSE